MRHGISIFKRKGTVAFAYVNLAFAPPSIIFHWILHVGRSKHTENAWTDRLHRVARIANDQHIKY